MDRKITADHVPGSVVLKVPGSQHGLEPQEAVDLADELKEQAQNAIHAERLGRRTT
ncbi:hypothetical protein [Curtobacterium sp. MCPF17_003]|uniref:hypothetical protein n=1 Tax=Curtobacterium sp. MCPF17_003 TaxID=2175637 RepID=UPI0015E8C0D5|nr:hypothetical protein [Curtobacterium sp. MCPF17_003]